MLRCDLIWMTRCTSSLDVQYLNTSHLAAACRPDALCTWTTSVTKREAPSPVWPPGPISRCLYRMHTSSRPKNTPDQRNVWLNIQLQYIRTHITPWVCMLVHTGGLRLVSCGRICPWKQGQWKHFRFTGMPSLHRDQSTQLRQWQDAFGHKLIPNIWIIVSAETNQNTGQEN